MLRTIFFSVSLLSVFYIGCVCCIGTYLIVEREEGRRGRRRQQQQRRRRRQHLRPVRVESSRVKEEPDCNNIIKNHLRTHNRPCLHHPTPSTTTSKRMSESSTQAVHTAAESSPKEKEKRKSTQAFPTQMESEAQFTAKVSPMATAGMPKCKDWQENYMSSKEELNAYRRMNGQMMDLRLC